ncbi:MAG: flagellar assembly protein H, partial [Cyanobacteria bacterium J06641_5]
MGEVSTGREVRDEARQIDVLYVPNPGTESDRQQLGLLGRMAAQPCVFEPYSSRPGVNEVRSCILKLLVVLLGTVRTAKREKQPMPAERELPMLWILSPSASPTLMERTGGKTEPSWPEGTYFMADALRTGFVAIDRLPETPDTLWLRLLGRNPTLERAIAELMALPKRPRRDTAVRILAGWKTKIGSVEDPDEEDRELLIAALRNS